MRTERPLSPLLVLAALVVCPIALAAQQPDTSAPWLRDRGPGIRTSMLGTYIRPGELLVYPFSEWYLDRDYEYKPSELGYGVDVDYRGRYAASEQLLFLSYGFSRRLAVEVEAAVIKAELNPSPADASGLPAEYEEAGLGDVEAQLRWRWREESATRPEIFSYFETVFPLQKQRNLIGTSDWEFKLGTGLTRGYRWGTMTVRAAVEYSRAERKFEWGEYAIEYLRRLSRSWLVVAAIEGNQLDEVDLITEVQWRVGRVATIKLNNGWGLTRNATTFAPELGVMLSF